MPSDDFMSRLSSNESKLIESMKAVFRSASTRIGDIIMSYAPPENENLSAWQLWNQQLSADRKQALMMKLSQSNSQELATLVENTNVANMTIVEGAKTDIAYEMTIPMEESLTRTTGYLRDLGADAAEDVDRDFVQVLGVSLLAAAGLGLIINDILRNPWAPDVDGTPMTYAGRMRRNTIQTRNVLGYNLDQAIAMGKPYRDIAMELATKYNQRTYNDYYRLVYTEGTRMFNDVQAAYTSSVGLDRYITSPVHDAKTCPICLGVEEQQKQNPAYFADRVQGVNFPPYHPWCRCKFVVYQDDWDAWLNDIPGIDEGTRAQLRDQQSGEGTGTAGIGVLALLAAYLLAQNGS